MLVNFIIVFSCFNELKCIYYMGYNYISYLVSYFGLCV